MIPMWICNMEGKVDLPRGHGEGHGGEEVRVGGVVLLVLIRLQCYIYCLL